MELNEILEILKSSGDQKRSQYNKNIGITNQLGVPFGNIRALAKKIKTNHALAWELWNSGIYEAMVLGAMLFDSKLITEADFETLIKGAYHYTLVDELILKALGKSKPAKDYLWKWIYSDDETIGRAGYNLAIGFTLSHALNANEIEILLSEIESKMQNALPLKQWAMNRCLCEIGIAYDEYTNRCIAIGEALGVYRDLKVAKGCTSSYAPIWITVVRNKYSK